METRELMRIYLRNLVRADAVIYSRLHSRVVFNGSSSPGSFNSRLFSEEIMIVKNLCEIGQLALTDQNLRTLLTTYLNYLSQLFRREPQGEWTHRYLQVMRDGKRLVAGQFCKTIRQQIGEYVEYQYEAFQRIREVLLPFLPEKTDKYRMRLEPTEFIELSLIFQTSERMECIGGQPTQIGMARYLANALGVVFPHNYNSLKAQLLERNQNAIFWNFLHSSFIAYLRHRK